MKYMLLTYLDEQAWLKLDPAEQKLQMDACQPHVETLLKSGKILGGAPLHPTSTATTVTMKNGKHLVTDGPFAETREQLGGYTLIEATDLDDAIAIASGFFAEGDAAFNVKIEVRPIVEGLGV
jgi:hypothetical protein